MVELYDEVMGTIIWQEELVLSDKEVSTTSLHCILKLTVATIFVSPLQILPRKSEAENY